MLDVLRMKISKRSIQSPLQHAIHYINPFNTSRSGVDTKIFFFCWQALLYAIVRQHAVLHTRIRCQIKFMSLINKQCQRRSYIFKEIKFIVQRNVAREWFFFHCLFIYFIHWPCKLMVF